MKSFINIKLFNVLLLIIILSTSLLAQAPSLPKITINPEQGVRIESADGEMGFQIGFRLQEQFSLVTPSTTEDAIQSDYNIRRARALFSGYLFHKKLGYLIQLGMDRGNTILLNAEYRWIPDANTMISFGQFFPPTSREFQTISKNLQMVDRSNVTRFFFTDYDLGVAVRHTFPIAENFTVKSSTSVTHGEGKNSATAKGGWAYVGRIELLPFGMFHVNGDYSESDLYHEITPKLSIGSAFYVNTDAFTKFGNSAWDGLNDNYYEYYFDFVFKYDGFSLLSEYTYRIVDNERLVIDQTTELYSKKISGDGFYIQGGKFISKHLEPTFRVSILNPNDANQTFRNSYSSQKKYAAGLNYFFAGHSIKLQTQIGYITESYTTHSNETYFEFLTQFTISF